MTSILISSITILPGRRRLDPAWVRTLADMMAKEGQLSKIEVVGSVEASTLVFGGHRLAAAKELGWTRILAEVRTTPEIANETQRRLREIAENLVRRELSVLDKAVDMAAWRDIYEATHLLNKGGRKSKGVDAEELSAKFCTSFSEAAQRTFGLSRRSIFYSIKIASIAEAVRYAIALHPVADNQSELLILAAEPPNRQTAIAGMLTAEPAQAATVSQALALLDKAEPAAKEARWRKLASAFSSLKPAEQRQFLEAHEGAILAWVKERPA